MNNGNSIMAVTPVQSTALAQIAGSREVTEAQAAIMVAKRFPRNEMEVVDKVMIACQRPSLAETALYTYSRGGTDISGPSIRLAETIFRLWGNAACGVRELESGSDESVLEAYAVDYETNVRQSKVFTVKHERTTKNRTYKLEDSRDRYENLANFGARRLRATMLALIPADIIEAAVSQVEQTLKAKADTSPEALKKLVDAFDKFGVTKEQIEKRIQRRIDAITPAQVVSLRKIYNSLKDGMSGPADWFEAPEQAADEAKAGTVENLKGKLRNRKKQEAEAAPQTEESDAPLPNTDTTDDGWPDPPGTVEPCPECGEVGGHAMSCPNAEPPEGE
jgi:hypothetical protein